MLAPSQTQPACGPQLTQILVLYDKGEVIVNKWAVGVHKIAPYANTKGKRHMS